MKLSEAFTNWSQAPRNTVLASKYRAGVNQVLMKQHGDTELSEITKELALDIMRSSEAARQLKVQAASALVYILQWGGDHGYCPRPSFSFGDIVPAENGEPVNQKQPKPENRDCPQDKTLHPAQSAAQPEPRHGGGRPPKAVAQIDPETLQVMKVWPVMAKVDAALNIGKGNVSRAVKKHQKAAGCYWCYADDTDAYIKELRRLHPSRRTAKKPANPAKPETIQDQREQVAVLKRQYETFNEMRPVAKEQPAPKPEEEPSPREPARQTIADFTDRQLFAELERRGWVGHFSKTEIITIGQS